MNEYDACEQAFKNGFSAGKKEAESHIIDSGETNTFALGRERILMTAREIVCRGRNHQYGDPENSFSVIAKLWNDYLGLESGITPDDVAVMMALLKIARIATGAGSKEDNYVDACGYMACAGEIAGESK